MKKKACPVGLICIETKYLIVLLCIFILILLYFLLNPVKNEVKHTPNSVSNIPSPIYTPSISKPCSEKKFLKKGIRRNNIRDVDKIENIESSDNVENINSVYVSNDTNSNSNNDKNIVIRVEAPQQHNSDHIHLINKDHERIINPLLPPERRNHYIDKSAYEVSHGVPINIPTRGYHGGAMQIGALYKQETSDDDSKIGQNNEPVIIPLFGHPTYNGSNKWMYYTSTDKFNQVKLPISNKNRQCNSEYGCDELYDGDIVQVPAYNGEFKVNKYEYDKPRYIPHIL